VSTPRLFGTDGVRGKAGEPPLDRATVARLGAGVVMAIPHGGHAARILVGRDTRESGSWIEQELARGARWAGAHVTSAGVVPTPAVAFLTREMDFDAGLVISASHNPFDDNGIKVFSGGGEKYDEELERHVESLVADESWSVGQVEEAPVDVHDFVSAYIAHVRAAIPALANVQGSRIALDCANGATTTVAPRLFRELGFEVDTLACQPDGRNINLGCGSTHPQLLARFVEQGGHRLGVAFDGDGDRAILVTHEGRLVDGDAVMLMCARRLKAQGRLHGDTVVATVMSNIGLELALRESGIALRRTPVGDKYVAAEIAEHGFTLGGEQSGHVIFADHLYTGDGIVTALSVINVMAESGRELADLAAELVTYPQVLVNVRVRERRDLATFPEVTAAIAAMEEKLAERGRLLVRYSGTEPLLRIMIEGKSQEEIDAWAHQLAGLVRRHLG
jgi:phosphoglucosamine mutase